MSKLETPITEGFWRSIVGGTFMAEYPLVRKSPGNGCRMADAVLLPMLEPYPEVEVWLYDPKSSDTYHLVHLV